MIPASITLLLDEAESMAFLTDWQKAVSASEGWHKAR